MLLAEMEKISIESINFDGVNYRKDNFPQDGLLTGNNKLNLHLILKRVIINIMLNHQHLLKKKNVYSKCN